MTDDEVIKMADRALNRVAKWRLIFAGMQLGTRPKTDPVCQAVRDQRELLILLRVEVSALTNLLREKDVFTHREFLEQVGVECRLLDELFEKRFPGMRSSDDGIVIFDPPKAAETMKGWPP